LENDKDFLWELNEWSKYASKYKNKTPPNESYVAYVKAREDCKCIYIKHSGIRRVKELYYKKKKRSLIDYCNICGRKTKLTWDHVPPKSVKIGDCAYADTLFAGEIPSETKYGKKYQNGVKYRTICQECNGDLLGKYDKCYARFIEVVNQSIESKCQDVLNGVVINPIDEEVTVEVQINKILRSILGHFLSMKAVYDKDTTVDEYLRLYLKDESLELTGIKLYTWLYPYSTIINLRDFATRGKIDSDDYRTHPCGMISIMNSYPLAYMISTENENSCCVDDIGRYSTENINDKVTITLHISTAYYSMPLRTDDGLMAAVKRKEFSWPANVSDDEFGALFVLGNDQIMDGSTIAIQK